MLLGSRSVRGTLLVSLSLILAGCFKTTLNGPIGGAEITVAPLDAPDQLIFSGTTADPESERARVGADTYDQQNPFVRLLAIGSLIPQLDVSRDRLYLVTASGGFDQDVDGDRRFDDSPSAISGQWRAIASGEQLLLPLNEQVNLPLVNVSALTEVLYQSVAANVPRLEASQILTRLTRASRKALREDLTDDGSITYLDALRWSPQLHPDSLRGEPGDLARVSLAIQNGRDQATIANLSNRFLGGPATFGLQEATTLKRSPDGTCAGRGAAIVSNGQESVTTLPPTSDCGPDDRGVVEATQGSTVGQIAPTREGFPEEVDFGFSGVKFSDYDLDDKGRKKVKLTYRQSGGARKERVKTIQSPDKLARLGVKYKVLDGSEDGQQSSRPAAQLSLAGSRQVVPGLTRSAAELSLEEFNSSITDALAYGTLVSSWTSCIVYDFLLELQAEGEPLAGNELSWASAGCLSSLVEVDTFVVQTPRDVIADIEDAVQEVVLQGCSNCYSYIASPAANLTVAVGEPVNFNGVAPANNLGLQWLFGDGDVFNGWSTTHAYLEPGIYVARFRVDYIDGSSAENSVQITVMAPEDACLEPPLADAGPDILADALSTVVLSGAGEAVSPPACVISSFNWQQLSGPLVSFDSMMAMTSFVAPDVDMPTILDFRLTVTDSDGNMGQDDVRVTVQAPLMGEDYALDDGTGYDAVSCPPDGEGPDTVTWVNRFDVKPGAEEINQVLIAFGDEVNPTEVGDPLAGVPGLNLNGFPVQVQIYLPTILSGHPADTFIAATFDGVVNHHGTDIFTIFPFPDVLVNTPYFFVGATMSVPDTFEPESSGFPARIDSVNGSSGDSWFRSSACFQNWTNGIPGNFMIRANGEPGIIGA